MNSSINLRQVFIGSVEISLTDTTGSMPTDRSITLVFSRAVDHDAAMQAILLEKDGQRVAMSINFLNENKTVALFPGGLLENNAVYTLKISDQLKGQHGETFSPLQIYFKTMLGALKIVSVEINGTDARGSNVMTDVPLDFSMRINFSATVTEAMLKATSVLTGTSAPALLYNVSGNEVTITTSEPLEYLTKHVINISTALTGIAGESFSGFTKTFYTDVDDSPQFPVIPDDELLTLVQQQTFNYFWDFAQANSGMARERNTSGDLVTSGGSGFGLMSIIVGIERGFITRAEGLERLDKVLAFLETSDRFHGAWPHWLNGNTGKVIPFGENDNGGDLVETSFLMEGLITFRQYLDSQVSEEQDLIGRINALWQSVEWDWYTRGGQDVLYWHWSPDKEWIMNFPIRGYNECLITYVLAASSPSHSIDKTVYTNGWARSGNIVNGNDFYSINLPLGEDYGGPLFFTHYSFLGLDPRSLSDMYANYRDQNVNHTKINYQYCVKNPKNYVAYSEDCWGLTASDNHLGYSAHSPTNDLGVIAPTAALSSFPYTPVESMKALKFFYYKMGDRLWGDYGFYDAFNITAGWTASSYLAIDQGPIIVMIENYRTELLWDLFMSAPEVQSGLSKLSFTY